MGHREDRSFDRNAAVIRRHVQMATALLGRFDDDLAAAQSNRGVPPAFTDRQLRPVAHFHLRSVAQA